MLAADVLVPSLPHFQLDAVLTPQQLADVRTRDTTLALLKRASGNTWLLWFVAGLVVTSCAAIDLAAYRPLAVRTARASFFFSLNDAILPVGIEEGMGNMNVHLDSTSLEKFLKQFTGTFTPELADHFATLPPDPEFQARLDELGAKANEGTLTESERSEYATYVEAMDVVALLRVKSLARSKKQAHQ